MYAEFHRRQDKFHGDSLGPHLQRIGELVKETGSRSVLDWGCGRARFWKSENLAEKWGVKARLYDPAVEEYAEKPRHLYDGVICTDVLEHVLNPEETLEEIFWHSLKFVYLSISCRPSNSNKRLSDGTEFHISIHPPHWWREKLSKFNRRYEVRFDVEG